MTYNTPELLLVGAAQNLVLGDVFKSDHATNFDSLDRKTYANDEILDSGNW